MPRLIDGDELYQKVVGYNGGAVDKTVAKRLIDQMPTVDAISRQAAIDALTEWENVCTWDDWTNEHKEQTGAVSPTDVVIGLPSAQPEIIRCKDCRWWDKYGDGTHGYCIAATHGHWSTHWEISIRRTYDGDWFCADGERRTV